MVAVTFYLAAAVLVLVALYIKYLFRLRRAGEPMIVPGSFLWGNAKDFSLDAVNFIHKQQKRFGDIFTIRLLNQHLTIINDPHTYDKFCKEKNFDFDVIQKQVNNNVFSFELKHADIMIKEASKTVRGNYLSTNMRSFSKHLNDALDQSAHVDVNCNDVKTADGANPWQHDILRSLASRTMFQAIFKTVFGAGKADDVFTPSSVCKNFDIFHKYFNYLWLGLPIKLFPEACKALDVLIQQPSSDEVLSRADVSDYIKFSTLFMKRNGQTEADVLGHNLVYLHVNYNTFRVTFWLIYYLMKCPDAYRALLEEVDDAVRIRTEYADDDGTMQFSMEEVDKLPILDSVVKETIRTTSGVFMVRAVAEDTAFEMENGDVLNLRKGDQVAMYPPAIHKDPEIYNKPLEFHHDRFVDATFYKKGREVKHPLLAFGSICPGQKLAMMEAKWFIFNFVHRFEFELLEGENTIPDVKYHGHEILPPTNDVQMRYRQKQHYSKLSMG